MSARMYKHRRVSTDLHARSWRLMSKRTAILRVVGKDVAALQTGLWASPRKGQRPQTSNQTRPDNSTTLKFAELLLWVDNRSIACLLTTWIEITMSILVMRRAVLESYLEIDKMPTPLPLPCNPLIYSITVKIRNQWNRSLPRGQLSLSRLLAKNLGQN